MNPLNCTTVQEQIELYTAGECDAPQAEAVAAHLAECADCAKSYEETRALIGSLNLRFGEEASLQRLLGQLRQEEKKRRVQPVILMFLRRTAAVAAMLLVVGMLTLLGSLRPPQPDNEPQVAIAWKTPEAQVTQLGPGRFEVQSGQVRLKVSPGTGSQDRDVEIVTPAGVARARDAEFFIEVQSPAERRGASDAAVTVLRGQVTFANAKGQGVIKHGETLATSKNSPPAPPKPLPEAAVQRLLSNPDAAPGLLPKK
jgi:ferric-dicitrate binding protein FerR (iron transport regulator)